MIEEQARVVDVRGDVATVTTVRHSACGSCDAKRGCGTSLLSNWFPQRRLTFVVNNAIGARPGDTVVVGLDEGRLQRASLMLYGLPLLGLLVGAVGGESIYRWMAWHPELGAVMGGLFGLTAALVLVRNATQHPSGNGGNDVRLLRVAGPTLTLPVTDLVSEQPERIRKGE